MISFLRNFLEAIFPDPQNQICAEELQKRHGDYPVIENEIDPIENYEDLCRVSREFRENTRAAEPKWRLSVLTGVENARLLDGFVLQKKARLFRAKQ